MNRATRRAMERENRQQPADLAEVPLGDWPDSVRRHPDRPIRVLRSRDFLVQVFIDRSHVRLSVCRTSHNGDRWEDRISWDDLQRLKREAGYGDMWAVEVYPVDDETVNVANMRHLWLLDEAPGYAWRKV